MEDYDKLTDGEKACVEAALDELRDTLKIEGVVLANDDRAARAANALARYILESRT